jgi:hypothetical protein
MAIVVLIINEKYEVVSDMGIIDTDAFEKIIKVATELNMKCLSLMDYVGDTFFNEKQMYHIKKEIEALRQRTDIDQEALSVIEKSVEEGLKDVFLYLKFEGE